MLCRLPPRRYCPPSVANAARSFKSQSRDGKATSDRASRFVVARRPLSTGGDPVPRGAASTLPLNLKVSHILSALLVFGIGATTWGLYDFYSTLTLWPEEVRGDLRGALRAKERGDLRLSLRHFARAWETVQKIPQEKLKDNPYLKVSGVAIAYAEVLEMDGLPDEAFGILDDALDLYTKSKQTRSDTAAPSQALTPPNTGGQPINSPNALRAIAIALKLGDLAEVLSKPADEDRCLNFAVAEVLRVIKCEYGLRFQRNSGFVKDSMTTHTQNKPEESSGPSLWEVLTSDDGLSLPKWSSVTRTELAAPFERLAAFSARQGKTEHAITLYRVASSFLTHPKSSTPPPSLNTSPDPSLTPITPPATALSNSSTTVLELCHALQIESAHMALLMSLRRQWPSDERLARDLPRVITRAARLANEATVRSGRVVDADSDTHLGQVSGAKGMRNQEMEAEMALCDWAYPAVLYNTGVYYEEENQLDVALQSFVLAYKALSTKGGSGMREQAQETLENVRRLQRLIERRERNVEAKTKPSTQN